LHLARLHAVNRVCFRHVLSSPALRAIHGNGGVAAWFPWVVNI
jgi:hypothetical protein